MVVDLTDSGCVGLSESDQAGECLACHKGKPTRIGAAGDGERDEARHRPAHFGLFAVMPESKTRSYFFTARLAA